MKYIFDKGEWDINNKSHIYKNSTIPMKYPSNVTHSVYIDKESHASNLLEVDIEKVMNKLNIDEKDALKYIEVVVRSIFRLREWEK